MCAMYDSVMLDVLHVKADELVIKIYGTFFFLVLK